MIKITYFELITERKILNLKVEINRFPDNTLLLKTINVDFSKPITITWHYENDAELFAIICLAKKAKDKKFLYMPYCPNSRQDRTKSEDDIFTLRYFAEIINLLNFDKVIILDPHSSVTEALFDRLIVQSPKEIIKSFIDENFLEAISLNKFSLFYPDEGAMKRGSDRFKIPYTFGVKKRDWETGEIRGLDIVGDENFIKGKKILIVDDICSRGGTFYHSAKKMKELGAEEVYLYVTHCENTILEGDLLTSGLIEKIFTTNSIFTKEHEKIEIYDLRGEA